MSGTLIASTTIGLTTARRPGKHDALRSSAAYAVAFLLLATAGCGDSGTEAYPGLVSWETAVPAEAGISDELLARGRQIYGGRCAICHGKDGDGNGSGSLFLGTPPRDFTQGIYKFRSTDHQLPTDQDLFRSITAGFQAYGMPSFAYLSVEDRWALVHYVKGFNPRWDQQTRFGEPEPFEIGPEPQEQPGWLERGRNLYENKFKCIDCHGASGHGDGRLAAGLKDNWGRSISPRDFTLGPTFRKAGWHRADTVRILYTGIPGTPMYSHKSQLDDPNDLSEFWDVARYVDHLIAQASAGEN